jgi:hypothetical protein
MYCPKCGAENNYSGNAEFVAGSAGWAGGCAAGFTGWLFVLCAMPAAVVAVPLATGVAIGSIALGAKAGQKAGKAIDEAAQRRCAACGFAG